MSTQHNTQFQTWETTISKIHERLAYWIRALPFFRAVWNGPYSSPTSIQKWMCFDVAILVCGRIVGMLWNFAWMISDWFRWFEHCCWCWHVSMWASNQALCCDLWSRCTSAVCRNTQFPPNWWLIHPGKVRKCLQMWLCCNEVKNLFSIWNFNNSIEIKSYQTDHPMSCTYRGGIWCT